MIDCSSGGLVAHQKNRIGAGIPGTFCRKNKNETGILTGSVGLITEAKQAEQILADKKADLIFIARQSLRDAYFPLHAAKELGAEIQWPSQYLRANNNYK